MPDNFSFQGLMDSIPQAQQQGLWQGINQPGNQLVAQASPAAGAQGIHTIQHGPEYDKWDEALHQYGTIKLPKELDDPQRWLNQPHLQQFLEGVDRRDLPDGSVILSKQAFTS